MNCHAPLCRFTTCPRWTAPVGNYGSSVAKELLDLDDRFNKTILAGKLDDTLALRSAGVVKELRGELKTRPPAKASSSSLRQPSRTRSRCSTPRRPRTEPKPPCSPSPPRRFRPRCAKGTKGSSILGAGLAGRKASEYRPVLRFVPARAVAWCANRVYT